MTALQSKEHDMRQEVRAHMILTFDADAELSAEQLEQEILAHIKARMASPSVVPAGFISATVERIQEEAEIYSAPRVNYLVSKDRHLSQLWMISKRGEDVPSSRLWDTVTSWGFFKTAREAKEKLAAIVGAGSLTQWTQHDLSSGRVYTAQDYTGLPKNSIQAKDKMT